MAKVMTRGLDAETNGELPALGAEAKDFRLTNVELADVGLEEFRGKRKVLSILTTVDTAAAGAATRKLDEAAGALSNTVVMVVSADLPFAWRRFRDAAALKHVVPLSLMHDRRFAEDYGVLLRDGPLAGLCASAVLVLDEDDKIVHRQLFPDVDQAPDYGAALHALP